MNASVNAAGLPDFAIEAEGLKKTYAATKTTPEMRALKGVDLKVPRGSIFGLLGPNGAGKSTFINVLAGMAQKTEGKVRIWGRDIDERPRDARAAIGVVPQEIAATSFSRRASRWRSRRVSTACRSPNAGPTRCSQLLGSPISPRPMCASFPVA